ncbi:hypothetical protein ACRJ4B_16050 [Streptomyces sp. GTA36]
MALGFKKPIEPDDPRLKGHETTYQASRGGWMKKEPKPVPGTPKK